VRVDHLDNLAALPAPHAVEPTPLEAFLERYRSYRLQERGLRDATAARYFYVAGQSLRFCSGSESLKLAAAGVVVRRLRGRVIEEVADVVAPGVGDYGGELAVDHGLQRVEQAI
jgi:hypothetical protein